MKFDLYIHGIIIRIHISSSVQKSDAPRRLSASSCTASSQALSRPRRASSKPFSTHFYLRFHADLMSLRLFLKGFRPILDLGPRGPGISPCASAPPYIAMASPSKSSLWPNKFTAGAVRLDLKSSLTPIDITKQHTHTGNPDIRIEHIYTYMTHDSYTSIYILLILYSDVIYTSTTGNGSEECARAGAGTSDAAPRQLVAAGVEQGEQDHHSI